MPIRFAPCGIFLVTLMLCGCDLPTAVWTKPGVTREQYMSDSATCRQQAREDNIGAGATTGANKRADYEQCMTDEGYSKQGEVQKDHLHNPAGMLESPQ